ncbi:hypothetical protein NPIL_384801 [Nephila pilipes]|uniref:Spider venom protein n=1 Tax=Nephila pilipes TaxID=299642 RepID=A0A8X6MP49_NEPPI|nr:hypothetical protein NPIL_384801 [Nephila pilipes]
MHKLIFIAVLVVTIAKCHAEEEEECGPFKRICRKDQFCYRPTPNLDFDLGNCMNYMKKGSLCFDSLPCEPPLECKEQKSAFIRIKICVDPTESTVSPTFSTDITDEDITNAPEFRK